MKYAICFWVPIIATMIFVAASPTPKPISDAELKKIPFSDIVKTADHLAELGKEQQATIAQQHTDLMAAQKSIDDLKGQIQTLHNHDADMTNCCNTCKKKLWWYRLHWWGSWIVLGLGVVACVVVAILKFTGKLAIAGAKL